MSNREFQVANPSFEEILEAVQETDRGRWFLAEYKNRNTQQSSGDITAALARIEARLEEMALPGHESTEWQQARTALMAAKEEVSRLLPGHDEDAEDKQAFARLAALAKSAFPEQSSPGGKPAVMRALQLVQDLDRRMSPTQVAAAPTPAGDKYFSRDADLFESPVANVPVQAAIASNTQSVKGARLVVVHNAETTEETVADRDVESDHNEPVPEASAVLPSEGVMVETSHESPQRILIVRRKLEDLEDVPLMEDDPTPEAVAAEPAA